MAVMDLMINQAPIYVIELYYAGLIRSGTGHLSILWKPSWLWEEEKCEINESHRMAAAPCWTIYWSFYGSWELIPWPVLRSREATLWQEHFNRKRWVDFKYGQPKEADVLNTLITPLSPFAQRHGPLLAHWHTVEILYLAKLLLLPGMEWNECKKLKNKFSLGDTPLHEGRTQTYHHPKPNGEKQIIPYLRGETWALRHARAQKTPGQVETRGETREST